MRRSYAAFDEASNWTYDNIVAAAQRGDQIAGVDARQILGNAAAYITATVNAQRAAQRQRGNAPPGTNTRPVTPGEVEAMMRELTDRDTWQRNLLGNLSGTGVSKDTTSLMRRADFHPDVRAWMQQVGLPEWDYMHVAALAQTGGRCRGHAADQLLDDARAWMARGTPNATMAEVNDMLRLMDIPAPLRALMERSGIR